MVRIVQRRMGLLVLCLLMMTGGSLWAQGLIVEEPNFKPTLTFDIVSIHQAPPPDANFHVAVTSPPHSSRFEATNLPVKTLLQIAYGFNAPVMGAPDWTKGVFFNILARSDEAADTRLAKLTDNEVRLEKRNAIRVMLAERFNVKSHMETRNSEIYNLTVSKGGVKMQAVPMAPAASGGEAAPVMRAANVQTRGSQHGMEFDGSNSSLLAICGALGSMVEAPVVDKTGLMGMYNYTLQFGREWSARDPDSYPSIFTAVQEQMGLKLEAVHEAVPNLVIDAMTKPTDN